MTLFILSVLLSSSWGGSLPFPAAPLSCECGTIQGPKSCGTNPAFMSQQEIEIMHQLGFDVPSDHLNRRKRLSNPAILQAFVSFLEKSDHSKMFYPEYFTRATKNNSTLTLKSKFIPKTPNETDEYFRCSIPKDKYCLYRKKLRPYLGLAAKASRIDYSFLACQSYVESRFQQNARSGTGALGYSQIQPSNIEHLNGILKRSIRSANNRSPASHLNPKEMRIKQIQSDIARIWAEFWKDTEHAPHKLCTNDLTCYRQSFLAQALALKTDMLTLATSSSGLRVDFDENGNFLIEGMDKGDSLLLLAGSYNIGVTKMIRLVSQFCQGTTKLKECLDNMRASVSSTEKQERNRLRDIQAITTYVMRIRDCSQQFSAEQLDFDDDARWTDEMRTEKQNQQRDRVAQCLLHPCKLPHSLEGQ